MTNETRELWSRALRALETARAISATDADAAASRAYYAAFYAASALLADRGLTFAKHSAVETAVHRDLVKTGQISPELGANFSWLNALRNTGDYGGKLHVSSFDAYTATERAHAFVDAISRLLNIDT